MNQLQSELQDLVSDPWLKRKLDPDRRYPEINAYIDRYCPEIKDPDWKKGTVIDLGPGAGEFLEICRNHGHRILGVDADTGEGGMGDAYLRASQILCKQRGVPVEYVRFGNWVDGDLSRLENRVCLINSRGSVEQMMSSCLDGPPHHEDHCADTKSWREDLQTRAIIEGVFKKLGSLLRMGGVLLIHANGAANTEYYSELVRSAASRANLRLVDSEEPRLHKWVKV